MNNRYVILCLAAGLGQYAIADTVVLKNGRVYEGEFTQATSRQVTFNLSSGGTRKISIQDIERIRFGATSNPANQPYQNADRSGIFAPVDPASPPAGSRTGGRTGAEGRAIQDKYSQMAGVLGQPSTDETPTPDGRGRFRHYKDASIYWSPETGAHEVHGAIRTKYAAIGWEKGALGYPTSDESPAGNGGRFSSFQHGAIYYHPSTGAFAVYGGIGEKWLKTGGEKGYLGYPLTDEKATPDNAGHFQHFQNGSIYWHPNHGAFALQGAIKTEWVKLGWEQSWLGYPTSDEQAVPNDVISRVQHFEHGDIYFTP
ncbi:MAG TPA: hypothetical protein VMZ52_13755, partial [Bryobacteraceae bacterium]|nr:hypothetical protein [Bryobacteraceae bacterium]